MGNLVNPYWFAGLEESQYTYWRWTPLNAQSDLLDISLFELAFASSPGGANLLPSAVSVTAPGAVNVPRLYDGLFAAASANIAQPSQIPTNTAYVQAQFSAPVGVAEVRITADNAPTLWALAGSADGVTWVGRGVYTSTNYGAGETKTFAIGGPQQNGGRAGSRVWVFQRNFGFGGRIRVRELAYATSSGGPQLATGGTPFARYTNGGIGTIANAFDGNTTSDEWATTAGAIWQPLGYYFATAPNPSHYRVTGAAADYPSDWVVYYLSNCADWVAADTRSGETGWTASETRTYAMAA